jgi:hypothetical protein
MQPPENTLSPALVRALSQNDAFMRGVCASFESAAQICARLDASACNAAEKSPTQSEVKPNADNVRIAA